MAFTFAQLDTRVDNILKEQATGALSTADKLTAAIVEEAIEGGVQIYSNDFPAVYRSSFVGDSTSNYKLSGTSAVIANSRWQYQWSKIVPELSVAGTDKLSDTYKVEPTVMPAPAAGNAFATEDWLMFTDGTAPTSGQTISFRHTAIHIINGMNSETSTTVRDAHFEALATVSAYVAAKTLEGAFGHTSDSTLTIDVTDYEDKSRLWASTADRLWKKYLILTDQYHAGSTMGNMRRQLSTNIQKRVQ